MRNDEKEYVFIGGPIHLQVLRVPTSARHWRVRVREKPCYSFVASEQEAVIYEPLPIVEYFLQRRAIEGVFRYEIFVAENKLLEGDLLALGRNSRLLTLALCDPLGICEEGK
jgi:hypothetical protein